MKATSKMKGVKRVTNHNKWEPEPGSPGYEMAAKSVILVAWRANQFLIQHPDKQGLFAGQKNKKKRKSSQKIQPV